MRKYDDEFKQQAVKKVFDGQSAASVSRELGVSESLVHKWKHQVVKNNRNAGADEQDKELLTLKKRVRELEQENEILKKAAIIFGRGS